MRNRIVGHLLLAAALLGACAPVDSVDDRERGVVELTRESFPPAREIDSGSLSILGFRLGMTRAEAESNAKAQQLQLVAANAPNSQTPCGRACRVLGNQGREISLILSFTTEDAVELLMVSKAPPEAPLALRQLEVGRRFVGQLGRLFSDGYSDALRSDVFGYDGIVAKTPVGFDVRYVHRGLLITVQTSDDPEKDFAFQLHVLSRAP